MGTSRRVAWWRAGYRGHHGDTRNDRADEPGAGRAGEIVVTPAGSGVADLPALPGVSEAVQNARSALAALHNHPANRRGWAATSAAASVRAARASAALDGGDPALDAEAGSISDPVLAGALRVAAALGSAAPVWRRSPLQVLARLHTLAGADLVGDSSSLGRPVRGASRIAALAATVVADQLPAPVLAAVVHGELLTLRPFGVADGVVARAAARLVAVSTGLDPHALGVPEVAQLRAGKRYEELAAGYAEGTAAGTAGWIVAVCEWFSAGAREGRSIADAAG